MGELWHDGTPREAIFNLSTMNDPDVTLLDIGGADGVKRLAGSTFEDTDFSVGAATAITINTNAGDDRVTIRSLDSSHSGRLIVKGGLGNDSLNAATAGRGIKLLGEAGFDTLTGSAFADSLNGGADHDTLRGGAGNDTLDGEFGDDIILGGSGDDAIRGADGNDDLNGELGSDTILCNKGRDTIRGGSVGDKIHGGEGNDRIEASRSLIATGPGDDVIVGFANTIDEAFTFNFDRLML